MSHADNDAPCSPTGETFSGGLESGKCYNSEAVKEIMTTSFERPTHCRAIHLQFGITLAAYHLDHIQFRFRIGSLELSVDQPK
jgi:hypothetical protein